MKVMISAGEASGDLHGAALMEEMRKCCSSVEFFGIGGKRMRKMGLNCLYFAEDLSLSGFTEVVWGVRNVIKAYIRCKRKLFSEDFALLILIDFPDFNFLLAKLAKARNIPVMYYISPQIWAWRRKRVKKIKKYVDFMVVIFPFELDFYRKEGIKVEFVGHPLVDIAKPKRKKEELLSEFGIDSSKLVFCLLPGSRRHEVRTIFPIMIEASKIIMDRFPNSYFFVPVAQTLDMDFVRSFLKEEFPIRFVQGRVYDILSISDFALVTSGTATLEAGYFGVPMVVLYKVSPISYIIAKSLIKVDKIAMANIVLGKKVVPELIQKKANPKDLSEKVIEIISNKVYYDHIKAELSKIKDLLGEGGAPKRAAQIAIKLAKGER